MSTPEKTQSRETTLSQDLRRILHYYLGGRRVILVVVVAITLLGLVLNWQWLVALGIAPLLLSLLPCAAMCALGLCMHKMGKNKNSCDSNQNPADADNKPSHPVSQSDKTV